MAIEDLENKNETEKKKIESGGMDLKTATIQVLQSEKKALQSEKKFVVTEFDEDCIGNPAAANSMITYKDYSERKKNSRVTLYDTLEKAAEHVKEYLQSIGAEEAIFTPEDDDELNELHSIVERMEKASPEASGKEVMSYYLN